MDGVPSMTTAVREEPCQRKPRVPKGKRKRQNVEEDAESSLGGTIAILRRRETAPEPPQKSREVPNMQGYTPTAAVQNGRRQGAESEG